MLVQKCSVNLPETYRQTDRQTDRQTATLIYEISTVWETKPRMTPSKDFWTVNVAGRGHVAQHPASYMTMIIIVTMKMMMIRNPASCITMIINVTMMVMIHLLAYASDDIYLLQLDFHKVAVIGRLVHKYIQKENDA